MTAPFRLILAPIKNEALQDDDDARRSELMGQADRLKNHYMLSELTKAQYGMGRQAIEDELGRLEPTIDPTLPRPARSSRSSPAAGWCPASKQQREP
jgi:hypothetical protein